MTPQRTEANERIDKLAERVDRAVARILELNEPARTQALELKSAIEEFHKDGLTLVVRRLKSDPRGKELLMELAAQPSVYTLFAMHGIVRTEATSAIPSQEDHSPAKGSTGFVPLGEVMKAPGWRNGPSLESLIEGKPFRLDVDHASIFLLKMNGEVHAFRNECAHQGLPLDGGMVDREACTITCPWHGFRYDAATGECLTAPQAQLKSVEIKIERGRIQVKSA